MANPKVIQGDILLDTTSRETLEVVRLIGNKMVEVRTISTGRTKIQEAAYYIRGITSGYIKRINQSE